MLYPVIDIGSNTVKMAVLDDASLFSAAPVFFKAIPLALRKKVRENSLPEEAIAELCEIIRGFCGIASRLTDVFPIAFATASLRGLSNADAVINTVFEKTGVGVELISGEKEAYCSFIGAIGKRKVSYGAVTDLGGGSCEVLVFRGRTVCSSVSLPFGCLTLQNDFFSGDADSISDCTRSVLLTVSENAPKGKIGELFATGGSAKAILKYKNTVSEKRSSRLSKKDISEVAEVYFHGSETEKAKMKDILKDRFSLVPAACSVFSAMLENYGKNELTVCRHGVREGYLSCRLSEKNKKL